jgi:hypothetical protein
VDEANVAAKSLEIPTTENARLQDTVVKKESTLEATRWENETFKASEAAVCAWTIKLEEAKRVTSAARKAPTDRKATKELLLQKWVANEVV